MLGVALVVVAAIGYKVLSKPPAPVPSAPAATQPSPAAPPEPAQAAPAVTEAAPAATVPTPAESASAAAPAESANAAPSAAAPSAAAPSASDGQLISVTLKSIPPKARFFHFGKEIGTAPFVLELKPGEKHAYEAGLPGYITRKVIVDGTKPEITVGLRKE